MIGITVAPGQTGSYASSPCAGSGSYEVTRNEISLGSYRAGEMASIGSFYQIQAIEIKGADAPNAYVHIPNTP